MSVFYELLIDIKASFRGWKLIIPALFILGIIIMSLSDGKDEISEVVIYYFVYTTIFMSPKLNKLHYLLPEDKRGRLRNLFLRCFGIFVYNILWYGLFLSISVLLSDYRYEDELRYFICRVIPFLITYSSFGLNQAFNPLTFQDPWLRRNRYKYVLSLILGFTSLFFTMLGISETLNVLWYTIFTVIAYIGAGLVLYWQIMIFKNTDLSFENIRKVEKLFS